MRGASYADRIRATKGKRRVRTRRTGQSKAQREAAVLIFLSAAGQVATYRQIAEGSGLSVSTARTVFMELEAAGRAERTQYGYRLRALGR